VEAERAGRRPQTDDAWIAATAIHRRPLPFTRNRDLRDLPVVGLTVMCFASPYRRPIMVERVTAQAERAARQEKFRAV
jgi:hypothetical protein